MTTGPGCSGPGRATVALVVLRKVGGSGPEVRPPGVLIYYLGCNCGCGCEANARDHFGSGRPCNCRAKGCPCVVDKPGEAGLDPSRGYGKHLAELAQLSLTPARAHGQFPRS